MIKFENTVVSGWEAAIRGMRNPMNSWEKSDSQFGGTMADWGGNFKMLSCSYIGPNDLSLMQTLNKAGTDHAKFMRFIDVTVDITAPLYWWKEFDTYKVGTVANSCSTMHKIHAKEFTIDDFSCEHLIKISDSEFKDEVFFEDSYHIRSRMVAVNGLELIIKMLNHYRKLYIETKDRRYWWQMIQLLPSSYNQKRTVHLNYQVIKAMYNARKNHKLDEWSIGFINWVKILPYSKELITGEE